MQLDPKKARSHTAYLYKRTGRKTGELLDCGTARIETETGRVHVFLKTTPIGGWTGYLLLMPRSQHQQVPQPPEEVQELEPDADVS